MVRFVDVAVFGRSHRLSPVALGQQTGGTADEAKAMLMKAIAAVNADKAKALDHVQQGRRRISGSRSLRVLYECQRRHDRCDWQSETSSQRSAQTCAPLRTLRASRLARKCTRRFKNPKGQITEVSYMSPKPGGDDTPGAKVSFVARADNDLGCGVGYQK